MIQIPELVKDALRDGRRLKNYIFNVLDSNGDVDFVIDNDTLVKESVKIDERMCSGDLLKFGLCEGSSLEFQYFDHPNINGRRIQALIDAQYMTKQTTLTETDAVFTVYDAGDYEIIVPANTPTFEIQIDDGTGPGPAVEVSYLNAEQTVSFNNCKVGTTLTINAASPVTVTVNRANGKAFPLWYRIPMGFYTVEKCSRQASTGIQKITAYNKLQSDYLDSNATELIEEIVADPNSWDYVPETLGNLLEILLGEYTIERAYTVKDYSLVSNILINSLLGTPIINSWNTSDNKTIYSLSVLVSFKITDYASPYDDCLTRFACSLDLLKNLIISKCPYANTEIVPYFGQPGLWKDLFYRTGYMDSSNTVSIIIPYIKGMSGLSYTKNIESTDSGEFVSPYIQNVYNVTTSTGRVTDANAISIEVPAYYELLQGESMNVTPEKEAAAIATALEIVSSLYAEVQRQVDQTTIENYDISNISWNNVTLRELQSAVYEVNCQFGQLDRVTDLFSGVELNDGGLYPSNTLYPDNGLYPDGAGVTSNKSYYQKLWTDENGAETFRNLVITYKGLDANNQEAEFEFTKVVNANGTTDYIMDNNWLFKNLVWTQADVSDYADAMAAKMENIKWFPFEMWAAGLPYVETGDLIEIAVGENTYPSYILQRSLKGIQNLQDTYINGVVDVF